MILFKNRYVLMMKCWHRDFRKRPTFLACLNYLEELRTRLSSSYTIITSVSNQSYYTNGEYINMDAWSFFSTSIIRGSHIHQNNHNFTLTCTLFTHTQTHTKYELGIPGMTGNISSRWKKYFFAPKKRS